MTAEQFMRHALNAMVRANDGKPVAVLNGIDRGSEHSVALEMAAARVALRALEAAL